MDAIHAKKGSETYRNEGCIEQIIFDIKNHIRVSDVEHIISDREIDVIHISALKEKGYRVEKLEIKPASYKISWSHCDTSSLYKSISI